MIPFLHFYPAKVSLDLFFIEAPLSDDADFCSFINR